MAPESSFDAAERLPPLQFVVALLLLKSRPSDLSRQGTLQLYVGMPVIPD